MTLAVTGYEIAEKIGEGGMAQVYRARQLRLDRDVALKIMLSRFSDDKTFTERFIREAKIAANLNHPHIVQIYDVDELDGKLFLSMELVKGGDLTHRLQNSRSKDSALIIFSQLCEALDYAHAQGYVHRDIKPANILFRENNSLALSDFGIAKAMSSDTNMTQTGVVVGTPSYMSPEQAQGENLTGKSDLYSVGVMAFQFVTGQLPFKADSSISVAIKHISAPIPSLPKPLDKMQTFFNKALAKNPNDRYSSGQEFSQAFAKHLEKIKDLRETQVTKLIGSAPLPSSQTETLLRNDSDYLPNQFKSTSVNRDISGAGTLQIVFMQINRFRVFIQKQTSMVLILLLALSVGGVGYFASQSGIFSSSKALSPGEIIRLEQLVAAADLAVREGRLVKPELNNAYEYFQSILQISPNDPIAIEGINRINTELITLTEQLLGSEKYPEAKENIEILKVTAQHSEEIDELQKRLHAALKARQQKLVNGLAKASQLEKASSYNKAVEYYHSLIPLQGEAEEASRSIRKIADEKISKAEQLLAQKRFSEARLELQSAKKAAGLLSDEKREAHITKIAKQISENESRVAANKRINELVSNGDKALARGNLDRPTSSNAWYFYTQALMKSPSNRGAQQGRKKVLNQLETQARTSIDNKNWKAAQDTINRLSQLETSQTSISVLESELEAAKKKDIRESRTKRKVSTLYLRADKYLKGNRPGGADKMYRQISKLSPNDPRLKKLGARIADGYVYLAQKEIDARDWRDVDVWVKRGLLHVPNHKKLLEQRAQAEKMLEK